MKWSVFGLAMIGLVAALAAAALVAFLRSGSKSNDLTRTQREIPVLYAARDLPAMSMIDSSAVVSKTVPEDKITEDCLSETVQVVGRVLATPLLKDQAFTKNCFASRNSNATLAATVRSGMRAVSLSLSDHGSLWGLLYPGSTVDVLASFRLPGAAGQTQDEAASITLLRGVQVLAVENRSIVRNNDSSEDAEHAGRERKRLVTVLINPRQAELLQLAQEHGTLSLALRNPMDSLLGAESSTLLSQISDVFRTRLSPLAQGLRNAASPASPGTLAMEAPAPVAAQTPHPPAPETRPAAPPQWVVTVLRGGVEDSQNVPMPKDK